MKQANNIVMLTLGMLLGALFCIAYLLFFPLSPPPSEAKTDTHDNNQPLYWVAPMDPNYKRDKPGKSPMGMDLIPVYSQTGTTDNDPGTVSISAAVVNNLGVRTGKVVQQRWHSEINTVGYVQFDANKLIHIHPRVAGWIEKLYVSATGDPVTKGQPLYQLYSPALVNAQEELLLALDRKNPRLVKAAENRLKALQLPRSAINKLKKTKTVQQHITFYAPQAGVVDQLNIRQGFYVKPGTTLMSIGSLAQVWVEAEVFERQAAQVTIGMPVRMSLDFLPGQSWLGQVDYIYPTLDPKTRTVKVRLSFDNPLRMLKPNMFAHITIDTQTQEHTLQVPKEAVIRTGTMDRVVLALGSGQFKSVRVTTGRFNATDAEILSGLTEGDRVVTSAQFLLDSESSKSADFMRMDPSHSLIKVSGVITAVKEGALTIAHDPVPEINWPAMTMDFKLPPQTSQTSPETTPQPGVRIEFEIADKEPGFPIKRYTLGKQVGVPELQLPESADPDEDLDWLDLDDEPSATKHKGHSL